MTEQLPFELHLFDHIFTQELSLIGSMSSEIYHQWNDIITKYKKDCITASLGLDSRAQARNCLRVLESLPANFDRFMVKIFERDSTVGYRIYQDNWHSMQQGYMTLTLYCALSQ